MRAYYCDTFALPLPAHHSFPMAKYTRLRERVAASASEHGIELTLPEAASLEDLLRVHCPNYVQRVLTGALSAAEQRKIGFPWSAAMAERSRRVSGATSAALAHALRGAGVAVNLAGGTHHAFYDSGGGYCIFNDSVVAARAALAAGLARRILVLDLDVHQGNGTAALCAGDTSITTLSVHAARNYPAIKPRSDFDVALDDGTGDAAYLQALTEVLPRAFDAARPDAVIYLAGADPFEQDRLGYLKLSKAGLLARDQSVLRACLARGVPLCISMAGGYAPNIDDIVDIHHATVLAAAGFAKKWQQQRQWRAPQ